MASFAMIVNSLGHSQDRLRIAAAENQPASGANRDST